MSSRTGLLRKSLSSIAALRSGISRTVVAAGFLLGGAIALQPAVAVAHETGSALDENGCHHAEAGKGRDRRAVNFHCHTGKLANRAFKSKEDMDEAIKAEAKGPGNSTEPAAPPK